MMLCPLQDAIEVERYGGKAASLAASLRRQLPVPGGFALEVDLVDAIARGDAEARELLDGVVSQLGGRVAARSSAIDEDSATASFAGQHLTMLNVTNDADLAEAIAAVRASGEAAGAQAYRAHLGTIRAARVAVVVQRLVDPEVAGVLFTRNPITGADEYVVECAWGLGEVVVSGRITPDNIRISKSGRILAYLPGEKDLALVAAHSGTREISVEDARVYAPCLDAQAVASLLELARRCESIFEGPQDLEWALVDDEFVLLQSRAVTTGGAA